jgi:hypothetical protein
VLRPRHCLAKRFVARITTVVRLEISGLGKQFVLCRQCLAQNLQHSPSGESVSLCK